MKRINRMIQMIILGATVALLATSSALARGTGNGWWKTEVAQTAAAELSAEAQAAVLEALVGKEGEYAAYATYAVILEEFGDVNPFSNIMAAEANHIEALKQVLDQYGVAYPAENPYLGIVEAPESLRAAAQAGVDAEVANVALYETQQAAVADYPDIVSVFESLQRASLEQHLPAFQRAISRFE